MSIGSVLETISPSEMKNYVWLMEIGIRIFYRKQICSMYCTLSQCVLDKGYTLDSLDHFLLLFAFIRCCFRRVDFITAHFVYLKIQKLISRGIHLKSNNAFLQLLQWLRRPHLFTKITADNIMIGIPSLVLRWKAHVIIVHLFQI